MRPHRRGESLIELLVALVILEVAGALALATALSVERAGSRAARGAATDRARWEGYRAAEVSPACTGAAAPAVVPFPVPATRERPPALFSLRCGR